MWWLMVAVTIAALALFLYVTIGNFIEIAFASVVWCIIPTPLVVFAIYAKGDLQTLGIGSLIPWAVLVGLEAPAFNSYFVASLWLLPMSAMCGVLAVAIRRWLHWNRWD
jgi:hypothetical protein